jgi:triphosphoribosyl-dephospho-CoA synthase
MADPTPLSIGLCAQLACVLEVTARKPGNVHRLADFDDLTHLDFLLSAAAIAPVMEEAPRRRVGETVLEAIRATRRVTATNTNLGIVLLLAPLASVPPHQPLRPGIGEVLRGLTIDDSRDVFAAIRLANPGGLGRASEQDVAGEPTLPLREVMALAAERDTVARQYVNGFADVFDAVATLDGALRSGADLEAAIIRCHLATLSGRPDSLIARKRGPEVAAEAARRARLLVERGDLASPDGRAALAEFDAWLRADGRGRNPGTTADLVTASLFVALCAGIIRLPLAAPFAAAPGVG